MPYVIPIRRKHLDAGAVPHDVGELTYLLQQKLKQFIGEKGLSYETLSLCLGALDGAKSDLIERVLVPYEQKKKMENGCVWYDSQGRIV